MKKAIKLAEKVVTITRQKIHQQEDNRRVDVFTGRVRLPESQDMKYFEYEKSIAMLTFWSRNPETQQGATILDEREKIWMARLNNYHPKGLNIQD